MRAKGHEIGFKRSSVIYISMFIIFGALIYTALSLGIYEQTEVVGVAVDSHAKAVADNSLLSVLHGNAGGSLAILLMQIVVILLAVRLFSFLFRYIGQPGVIGEIVAGIALGPSLLGRVSPEVFNILFPESSLGNIGLLSQIGLILFMFVIGLELDFKILKNKLSKTLIISHAGIFVPFFLGIVTAIAVYPQYVAHHTDFLPFALFIGISMSITAFPVLARIVQERGMAKSPIGVLSLASAANDDVTAWCLLAIVIAIAKAGTIMTALLTTGLVVIYILFMFLVLRPFMRKIGEMYATSEVINKTFVGFIFLILILSSLATEIIGVHALFGAFVAGVIMPTNIGFRKVMMEKVEDIALVLFLPLFFVYTGLRTQIGLINSSELWVICAVFVVVAIAGKLGGCAIAARITGERWKESLVIGTLMNTRGLMELVALNIGYEMGILPPPIFVILILMALITTFITTPILSFTEYVFGHKKSSLSVGNRILIAFGKPYSGKRLLEMANIVFGKQLTNSKIVATHFTFGTDLNPAKAVEYSRESFRPFRSMAQKLHVKFSEQYYVTDKFVQDMISLTHREQIDLLLLGAGAQFMKSDKRSYNLPLVNKFMRRFQSSPYNLPGDLHRNKLYSLMNHIDCEIGILVDRGFSDNSEIDVVVGSEQDFFLLDILVRRTTLKTALHKITVIGGDALSGAVSAELERDNIDVPVINSPIGDVHLADHSFLLISYQTCLQIATTDQHLYMQLPSMLVIRPARSAHQES